MSITNKLHPERVPDERLSKIWEAVYEGYTKWNNDALDRMAAVGDEVCSCLEELVELRARLAYMKAVEQAENEGLPCIDK